MILTGHPRSGTTLLYKLCASHPEISLTKEFGCFRISGVPLPLYVLGVLGRCWAMRSNPILLPSGKGRIIQLLASYRLEAQFLVRLRRLRPTLVTFGEIERALRHLLPEAQLVGDKFTDCVFNLGQFAGAHDLATVVIYRDCRDVVASYLERIRSDWRHAPVLRSFDTPAKIAGRWVAASASMIRFHDAICAIRYEDLVRRPQPELEKLGKWLGIDAEGFNADLIHSGRAGRHGACLTAAERSAVMAVAGSQMAALGYE